MIQKNLSGNWNQQQQVTWQFAYYDATTGIYYDYQTGQIIPQNAASFAYDANQNLIYTLQAVSSDPNNLSGQNQFNSYYDTNPYGVQSQQQDLQCQTSYPSQNFGNQVQLYPQFLKDDNDHETIELRDMALNYPPKKKRDLDDIKRSCKSIFQRFQERCVVHGPITEQEEFDPSDFNITLTTVNENDGPGTTITSDQESSETNFQQMQYDLIMRNGDCSPGNILEVLLLVQAWMLPEFQKRENARLEVLKKEFGRSGPLKKNFKHGNSSYIPNGPLSDNPNLANNFICRRGCVMSRDSQPFEPIAELQKLIAEDLGKTGRLFMNKGFTMDSSNNMSPRKLTSAEKEG